MKNYSKFLRVIKKRYPQYNIVVHRLRISRYLLGDCDKIRKNKFKIRINKEIDENQAIETLIHEMAHVLSWDHPGDDHGPSWGLAYSEVYRIYLKDFLGLHD